MSDNDSKENDIKNDDAKESSLFPSASQKNRAKTVYQLATPSRCMSLQTRPKLTLKNTQGRDLSEFKAGEIVECGDGLIYTISAPDGETEKIVDFVLMLANEKYGAQWFRNPKNNNAEARIEFRNKDFLNFIGLDINNRAVASRLMARFRKHAPELVQRVYSPDDPTDPVKNIAIFLESGRVQGAQASYVVLNHRYFKMPMVCNYPQEMYTINTARHPNAIPMIKFLCHHQRQNRGKPNENIVMLETMLKYTRIKYFHEAGKRHKELVFNPLVRDLHPTILLGTYGVRIKDDRNNKILVEYYRGQTSSEELDRQLQHVLRGQLTKDSLSHFRVEFLAACDGKTGADARAATVEKQLKDMNKRLNKLENGNKKQAARQSTAPKVNDIQSNVPDE
jgi:hypothetical protein